MTNDTKVLEGNTYNVDLPNMPNKTAFDMILESQNKAVNMIAELKQKVMALRIQLAERDAQLAVERVMAAKLRYLVEEAVGSMFQACGNSYINAWLEDWLKIATECGAYSGPTIGNKQQVLEDYETTRQPTQDKLVGRWGVENLSREHIICRGVDMCEVCGKTMGQPTQDKGDE